MSDPRFYCEWTVKVFAKGFSLCFTSVGGLKWETPDRYGEEMEREGSSLWL
jgi:hypothetical protein